MIHDPEILAILDTLEITSFSGVLYRATSVNHDPLAASHSGGRWAPRGECSVLYTSLDPDGALAEITYYWGLLTPLPTKPVALSRIETKISRSLRVAKGSLEDLGVNMTRFTDHPYDRLQQIGAAAAFQNIQGILVPNARWECENLVIFTQNLGESDQLEVIDTDTVDWQSWGKGRGLL